MASTAETPRSPDAPPRGGGDVLILCYHGVSPTWPATVSVDPAALERQLRSLLRRGYRATTFRQAVLAPPWPRTLAVTFDDAMRSVAELAFPVLERLGVAGSVYAPTDYVEAGEPMAWSWMEEWVGSPHEHELRPMSWEALRRLAGAGWEVGSHSCSHPWLTRVADDRLEAELGRSRAVCEERLDRPCDTIAYPYGNVDARVAAAARRAGYVAGAAVSSRRRASALDWPRVGVWRGDAGWRFRVKVAGGFRRARLREPALMAG